MGSLALALLVGFCAIVVTDGHRCADGEWECSNMSTCCLIGREEYGCCPLANAVCCADLRHCCPYGTACDTLHQRCLPDKTEVMQNKKVERKMTKVEAEIICPDGVTRCPSKTTCCEMEVGFGCCPMLRAVCCADRVHCCPHRTHCDTEHGMCIKTETNESFPWFRKLKSMKSVIKPNGKRASSAKSCRNRVKCSIGDV